MTAASAAVYISVADSHWQSGLSLQQFDQLRAKLLPAKMTPIRTNYVEIQQDEMEALRSIYMDDFVEEEAKMGAWNKAVDRAFRIRIKATSGSGSNIALSLSVSFPATYPKSLPRLSLTFDDGVLPKTRKEAQNVISSRPKTLLGMEMIFEIATALQDILDQASDANHQEHHPTEADSSDIPNLHQERAIQEAAITQKERFAEEVKEQTQKEVDEEEQRQLSHMIEQEKLRMTNRKNKQPAMADPFEVQDTIPGGLQFDQPVTLTNNKGVTAVFHTVHQKVEYRQGTISKTYTVHRLGSQIGSTPFLALKEYHVSLSSEGEAMKKQIQDLESLLDKHKHLPPHPNISRPLNFDIQRSLLEETSARYGWNIYILAMLFTKGSVREILDITGTLNIEIVRNWAIQLLEALDFYHQNGIVHATVHVGNILMEEAETGNTIVKLADGGYGHSLRVMKACESETTVFASDDWRAPELIDIAKSKPIPATDIWDLGVALLQMIFGLRIKEQQVSPSAYLASRDISRSLGEFFQFMFMADPRKRKSAFDLKMFEFFRTEESVFREPSSHIVSENLAASLPTSTTKNPRRDSIPNPPNASRYMNDFEEIGRLGRGGYGEVIKARHKLENQVYAIKKIKQNSASALSKVLGEIVMLSKLNHPNVVRYFTAWTENDVSYRPESPLSSSSGGSALSLTNGNPDGVFAKSSGGLDFIGADPPNIVFGFDDDDDDDEDVRVLDSKDDTEDKKANESQSEEDSDSWGEDEDESDEGSELESDDGFNNRMLQPRRRHSSIHESVVGATLYIQMQYCERNTLRDVILNGLHSRPEECWRLFRQILHGLVHIHTASIVHRDLKPENIFIDFQNDVRIGDFGLARPGVQTLGKANKTTFRYASFTKSIGTAFYIAPEVRSAGKGTYNEKADMYSLGIILFEMCMNMDTGMERAQSLGKIRKADHILPTIFNDPNKSTQGNIILSLISHRPSDRPSSSELLLSGRIPAQPEDELIRAMLGNLRNSKSLLRHDLLAAIFSEVVENDPHEDKSAGDRSDMVRKDSKGLANRELEDSEDEYSEPDPLQILEELSFDLARPEHGLDDINVQNLVKMKLVSVFHRHGALELSAPLLHSYSKFYSNYTKSAFKVLRYDNKMMQAPYDLTLPHARYLATEPRPIRKSFTFGDVWRDSPSGDLPKVLSEVDFNLVSYSHLDHAIREAEIIKTVDEVIDAFPSLAAVQLCYHVNHSRILDAILKFCRIDRFKRPAVKDEISKLNFNNWTWAKLKHNLRAPPLNVAATSLEELQRFDFRDTFEKALPKLRSMLQNSTNLEETFSHLQSVMVYLGRFNVKRKIYVNPLSSFNEKFFRGKFLFQCIYDNKKRDVFAAGGRYDRLVKYFRIDPKMRDRCAVGFSMNWQALCPSMVRYHQKTLTKLNSHKPLEDESNSFWVSRRCDVLVDSFERELLLSIGIEIVTQLWSSGIGAELGIDVDPEEGTIQSLTKETKDTYSWVVLIKNDGSLKVRNSIREETELVKSELVGWLRSSTRERERVIGRKDEKIRFTRNSSHQESANQPSDREADVRILMSQNKGKKVNRKTVVEEAQSQVEEIVRNILDRPLIAAVETKDDTFEGFRATRLADPESWKKFIQSAPPNERQYLGQVHQLLKEMARDAKPTSRSAFIYNFRTKNCILYDLGITS